MRRLLDGLYRLSGVIAAAFIATICIIVVFQVVLNAIDRLSTIFTGSAIGLTIPSYSDFTGFFLTAATFFALAYTLREGGHIRVSLIIQNLPPGPRRMIELWCLALATCLTAYFTWFAANLVAESYIYNDLSAGIVPVPIWIPQASIVAGLVVLTIALADDLVVTLAGGEASYVGKQENLLSGITDSAKVTEAEAVRAAARRNNKPGHGEPNHREPGT